MAGHRRQDFPAIPVAITTSRQYVCALKLSGAAVPVHINSRNAVQAQEDKVHQVVLRKGFRL